MAKRSEPVIGRGERVFPGVFRLRLPLPWPGVPHGNAWAIRHGDRLVLVDSGYSSPDSMEHVERALEQCGHRVEDIELVVCTHAHSDHCGNAATIARRAGCEVWMHPDRAHMTLGTDDPEAARRRRFEVALSSGVPREPLEAWMAERAELPSGIAEPLEIARDLVPGVVVQTDLGPLEVVETPGHAPSHVCLHQPDRRILISGDHVLGRVSLFFEHGFSPDPVGEYLASLDRVRSLEARLCLAGHARPFTDVQGHIDAHRAKTFESLARTHAAVGTGAATAYELTERLYGEALNAQTAAWLLSRTLCDLEHLEVTQEVARAGEPERWALA